MPSIPILGSLFGTKAADASKMSSFPDQRSDDEWRAVLNKGTFFNHLHMNACIHITPIFLLMCDDSVSSRVGLH